MPGAVFLFRPLIVAGSTPDGLTGAVFFFSPRVTAGRWQATAINSISDLSNARSLLPQQRQPIGYAEVGGKRVPVYADPTTWYRYWDFLANVTLGGPTAPPLGDIVAAVLAALAQSQQDAATVQAVVQQAQSSVDAVSAITQVLQTNSIPGSEQIPPVQFGMQVP